MCAACLGCSGNTLRVDDETAGFCELLQAEHTGMTALTWRERRCMFPSSPRKARPSRLQRTRPAESEEPTFPRGWTAALRVVSAEFLF